MPATLTAPWRHSLPHRCRYSNFRANPAAPVDTVRTSGDREARAKTAGAFPLLTAALPGLAQSEMPLSPAGAGTSSHRARTAGRSEPAAGAPRPLDRQTEQSPRITLPHDRIAKEPNLQAVFGLPSEIRLTASACACPARRQRSPDAACRHVRCIAGQGPVLCGAVRTRGRTAGHLQPSLKSPSLLSVPAERGQPGFNHDLNLLCIAQGWRR